MDGKPRVFTRAEVLTQRLDADGHVVLRLRSGVVLEGWLVDVTDDHVRFEWAPSPLYAQATGTDTMAPPAEDIRIDELEAYLDDARVWQPFPTP